MNDFNKILSAVKSVTESQVVKIFVPSANEEFVFKPLTAKQQKDLVKTAAEKNSGIISFYETLNSIINTNSIKSYEFYLFDREYIVTMLRALNLSNKLTVRDVEYDLLQLQNNRITMSDTIKTKIIETDDISLTCGIPTLKTDSTYNTFLNKATNKNISETFGDLFIFEVIKYIQRIKSASADVDIVLDELNVQQRYQLVESLPAKIYNNVIDYISDVKNKEKELFKINGKIVDVEMNQGFFTA